MAISSRRHCSVYWISNFSCGPRRAEPNGLVARLAERQEAIAERLDIGPSVGPPGGGMGMAERLLRLWPQLAVCDGATSPRRWLLDQRWVREPPLEVGAARRVPALEVQLAQTASTHSVTTRRNPQLALGRWRCHRGSVVLAKTPRSAQPSFLQRRWCPAQSPLPRAGRVQPSTPQAPPPNIGSVAEKVRLSARNSGRTAPMSRSSSPETGGFPAGYAARSQAHLRCR